jgi:hypothetical protein
LAALLLEVPERTAGNLHLSVLGRARAAEFQVINIANVGDNAAADAETYNEVFQVCRRHQHHGLADVVIGDRQRHFFRQRGAGDFSVFEIAKLVALAGGGRGRLKSGRRADWALGVHGAVPTADGSVVRLGATKRRV